MSRSDRRVSGSGFSLKKSLSKSSLRSLSVSSSKSSLSSYSHSGYDSATLGKYLRKMIKQVCTAVEEWGLEHRGSMHSKIWGVARVTHTWGPYGHNTDPPPQRIIPKAPPPSPLVSKRPATFLKDPSGHGRVTPIKGTWSHTHGRLDMRLKVDWVFEWSWVGLGIGREAPSSPPVPSPSETT